MKKCSNEKCLVECSQPLNNFYKDTAYKDGYKPQCKTCWQERNKKYYSKNKNLLKQRVSNWKKANPEKNRNSVLKSKYGITVDDYNGMLLKQKGSCAICPTTVPDTKGNKFFYVDHNHLTGAVRGLLCYNCNIALGMLKDDIAIASRLVEYLIKYEKS